MSSAWFGLSKGTSAAFFPLLCTFYPSPTWVWGRRPEGPAMPAWVPAVSSSAGLISSHAIGARVITQARPQAHVGWLMSNKWHCRLLPQLVLCIFTAATCKGFYLFIDSLEINIWNVLNAFKWFFFCFFDLIATANVYITLLWQIIKQWDIIKSRVIGSTEV